MHAGFTAVVKRLLLGRTSERPEYPFWPPRVTTAEWQTSPILRTRSRILRPGRCCRSRGRSFGGKHGSRCSARLIH